MNDLVIHARDLCKVYRLYAKPSYRVLDMFRLLPRSSNAYTEHTAVADFNVDVLRGEKVAVIGRNGAGKSTLLRLITKVIEPTSGTLEVNAKINALLQIGTGFHPEFTGRQNVLAYLAQLGVAGSVADQLCTEAIAFAELEEYADQPVKTYSTGMGVRLMFATSTAIAPDVLVLDEVLGVGDAYFAQKSFERIQELCQGAGTTLLLVTHDVYSAMKVCTRFIWLDRGRLLMDGPSRDVVHAYEQSIRAQEEHRLRLKRMATASEEARVDVRRRPFFGQIQVAGQRPPDGRLAFAAVRLLDGETELARWCADEREDSGLTIEIADSGGNWGERAEFSGRTGRGFKRHGSIFHRLPFLLTSPGAIDALRQQRAAAELTFWSDAQPAEPLELAVFDHDGRGTYVARFAAVATSGWHCVREPIANGLPSAGTAGDGVVRYGERAFEVTNVRFLDLAGAECHVFRVGSGIRIVLSYRVNDPDFDETPTLIVAFHKDGITRSHRFWTNRIAFRGRERPEGCVEVVAEPLLLAAGTYTVTLSVFRAGYFESSARHRFFSSNPEVLDIHSRGYEIVVSPSANVLCNDVVFQHPAVWLVNGERAAETEIVRDER